MNGPFSQSLWSKAVSDFGVGLGMPGLTLPADNTPLRLHIENVGDLDLETRPDGELMLCLTRHYPNLEEKTLIQALQSCYPARSRPLPVKVGLLEEDKLVFIAFLGTRNCRRAVVEQALQILMSLHEQLKQ